MIKLTTKKGSSRLFNAMESSWRNHRSFRDRRHALIQQYCGSGWGEGTTANTTMSNLMALTVDAYLSSLVANDPQVLISTASPELKPFSKKIQATLNQQLVEIHYASTLAAIVLDAFFGAGYSKTFISPAGEKEYANPELPSEPGPFAEDEAGERYRWWQQGLAQTIWLDPGEPMSMRISPDDFGFDHTASAWDRCRFMWDEYSVPRSVLEKDERLSKSDKDGLQNTSRWANTLFEGGESRTSELSAQDNGVGDDNVEPMVRVADVWLPFENKAALVTSGRKVLWVDDYDGPESGPYNKLQCGAVPDNVHGKSPAEDLEAMHKLYNSLLRKLARQARGQKRAHMYSGDGKDAANLRDSQDGEWIKVNNPDNINSIELDGPNQGNIAFTQILEGIHSRAAGNLDAKAGLGPQPKPASQEGMLHQQLSGMEEGMRHRVVKFVENDCRKLLLFTWADEEKQIESQFSVPGLQQPINVHWTPDQREGDLIQYHLTVAPYSMQYKSPATVAEEMSGAINMIANVAQANMVLAPQGIQINVPMFAQELASLSNQPRLAEMIQVSVPDPMQQQGGAPPPPGGGNSGPNHSVRENISTMGGPAAQRVQTVQALQAGAPQPQGAG